MPGILSTNNPVVKVSGLRPSTLTTGLLVLLYHEMNLKVNQLECYRQITITSDAIFCRYEVILETIH